MTERPIFFNATMVQAILAGRKTQTRRVLKPPFELHSNGFITRPDGHGGRLGPYPCPYGRPGDRIWVRETFFYCNGSERYLYRADSNLSLTQRIGGDSASQWRPSIHMPRRACRIVLEITDVRVVRLQAISEADARAEGVECVDNADGNLLYRDYFLDGYAYSAQESYESLWNQLYGFKGPTSWAANPWVWVVSFKRVEVSHV